MTTTNTDIGGEWDSGNYQILPEGYYKASVKSAEAKVSQNQNRMVTLVLEIEHNEYDGVTIYHHLIFMPDADNFNNKKRRWFQASAGVPYNLSDSNENVAKLIAGRKLTIKVKTGKDREGKERNEIIGVHSYNWTDDKKVDDNKLDLDSDLDDSYL